MGIASGIEAAIPEIPFVVQGKAYVASFVDNSAADRNPARGAFDFDLTGLDLKGTNLTITANYVKGPAGTANPLILTSPFSDPVEVVYTPGSLESIGLRRIVADTIIINQGLDSLDNWEPYSSVLGNSTFLIECNAFAEPVGGNQRFVVGAQPVNGGPMALLEAFYADNGQPFTGQINASRQNGNPGRVAGDKRPGAVNYITGAEASPHVFAEFQSDNRWNLGMDRLVDGRYGTVQTFTLNVATLQATSRCKAFDSANGRLTSGTAAGNQITRFGGEVAGLDNGNFVSVVEDRSRLRNPDGNCVVATIIAPDGTIVKDSWVVANGDIWSNVAACQGGFVVRASGVLYFHDNAGNLLGTADQNTSGQTFDRGRGDGFRIAGHINSPYVFLGGRMSDGMVKVLVWDTRNRSFVGLGNVSEGAFSGGFDRVNLGVDALNRVTVGYVSQPAGYEQQQVAARVLALDAAAGLVRPLTPSFLPFINSGPTGGFRSLQMTVSMTTRQIMVAAKGELNLSNRPEEGANSPRQMNFYTVFAHPAPADDPTTPVGGPLRIASTTVSGGDLTITWTGGVGPFQVQKKASLSDASWGGVQTTANRTITVPASGGAGFFRIVGQ
jgi:hypothetical protein